MLCCRILQNENEIQIHCHWKKVRYVNLPYRIPPWADCSLSTVWFFTIGCALKVQQLPYVESRVSVKSLESGKYAQELLVDCFEEDFRILLRGNYDGILCFFWFSFLFCS